MGYERYPRSNSPMDYGRDYGSGTDYTYSSARDFEAAGEIGGDQGRRGYGQRDYGNQRYGQRDAQYGNRDYGSRGYEGRGYGGRDEGSRYGAQGRGYDGGDRYGSQGRGYEGGNRYGGSPEYHGSYASDGRRFEDVGRHAHDDDDNYARDSRRGQARYGSPPQGYNQQERGFFERAGDEVRSWFGDEDAERRRDMDQRYDERSQGNDRFARHHDSDYHSWRAGQVAALDRDYDEYRQEHRSKFENEFSTWRTARQGQRDSLSKVSEHMDVVGSDGEHVGTVDKVRGDRILLTKNDRDAGGHHHSIPSRWIQSVDGKVTLAKTAAEAKQHWQDEERSQAMFQYGDNARQSGTDQNRGSAAQSSSNATSGAKTY